MGVPKLLVVAFDGTWHGSVDAPNETVVSSLPDLISKGEEVRRIRVNGVGTDGFPYRILGGLGGWGTRRNVITAYINMADDYKKGDRIIFCGYSRGAWAARYLAMIIGCLGLVREGNSKFFKRLSDASKKDPYLTKASKDELRRGYLLANARNRCKYAFHALALHGTRSPYSPTYMCGHNVHQVFFLGDHGNMGKLGEQEGLVHAPLAWMVQQLSSHLNIIFDEDKLKIRFPSCISEEYAEMMSRQETHGTTHEAMMKHAWCCPSGSIPGAGVGRLVIMGRKDRNPGMVLSYCGAECNGSSTDESTQHEAASAHAQVHIGARGRLECGFSDAVPGYLGVPPLDPNQVFFWKKRATGEQEVVAADIIPEAKVGYLEARLLGLPIAAASHPDCCGLNLTQDENINNQVLSESEETLNSRHHETKHASGVPSASAKPTKDAKASPASQSPAVDITVPIKQDDLKQENEDQDSEPIVRKYSLRDKTFNQQSTLDKHNTDKHGLEKEDGNDEEASKAEKTNSTFHQFDLLEQHVIRHKLRSDEGPVTILKCDFCDKTFYSDDELEEHMKTTYRLNSYDGWQDTDEEDYEERNDEDDEDNENDEEDDESGEESDEQIDEEPLNEPVKEPVEKSAEKPVAGPPPPSFKCQTCDEAFYFAVLLHEHERKVDHGIWARETNKRVKTLAAGPPPPTIKCELCDEAFYYVAMLREHQEKARHSPWEERNNMAAREPVQPPQHKCEDCSEAFHNIGKLEDLKKKLGHGTWATEKNKPVEKPVERPITVFKCTDCGRPYRDAEPFMDHMYQNHGRDVKNFDRYIRNVAPEDDAGPFKTVTSGFRCKPCNEPFRSPHLLAKHWEKTHADTWWSLFGQDNVSDVSLSYSEFQDFDNYDEDDMLSDLREINSWSSKKNTIPCITCWKKFKTSSQMVDHVEIGKFHSSIDARSIKWAIEMSDQSVVSKCYSEDKFQCPGCEATFSSLSSLIFHAEGTKCDADIAEAPLKSFMSEKMADDNPTEASSAKPEAKVVNCNICNKSFPHKGSLRRHRQSKHLVKKAEADADAPVAEQDGEAASTFDCTLCKQSFPRQSSLRQHQRSKHGPAQPDTSDTHITKTPVAETRPEVSAANGASTSVKEEAVNQDEKGQQSKITCSVCDRSFNHRGALYHHKKTKHRTLKTDTETPAKKENKTPDGAEANSISCDVCNKSFTSRNSLRRHLKSKHTSDKKGKGPAQADHAHGSSKKAHTTLKERHILGSQKHKCVCCNESFPSDDALVKHQSERRLEAMRQVMENMAMAASGRRVSTGQDGSDEESQEQEPIEETATEEKEASNIHQCTLCDKTFSFKSALVQHGLIKHAVADSTVAESSGQGANATAGGKKAEDVGVDEDDKPYCQTCQRTFRHAKGLADHKLNKHGIVEAETTSKQGVPENPTFRCRPCNKTFRLVSALRQHQRDSHPEMHRPRYSEDNIMRQLLRMAVPPFGDDDGGDDYEDDDYEDNSDDPFSYPGHSGFGRHQFDFPAGIQPGDIYDSDDPGFGYPGFSDEDYDDDDDDSDIDLENERGPPTLCTHCNESFPQMSLVGHQWHAHGISCPDVVDVQAKIAKDESYGPKRTVCKSYPDTEDFPFFFEAKYFMRDCSYKNCGQSFETGTERIDHEVEAHNRCITCEMYFKTMSALEKHQSKTKVVDTVVRDFDHWLEFAVGTRAHEAKQREKAARNPDPDKNIDCITCERKFEKASTMMKHVENGRCIPGVNQMDMFALGQILAERGAPCVKMGGFCCPVCDRSYMVLSELIQHAEGDECSLNVLTGPLQQLISLLMMEFMDMIMSHIS
ncbi:hypothetical protein FGADI_4198 [Fusarium gaditjirri]|uniref:C2H2-type domain-containing protein n=1 Tax=Fusarium gaditjirri TaxID=282569 RepID=A0A8H4TDL0_9HYPO|nr:hypothetical protein FGADI_4198 [Fusarium gaditjirri]